MTRLGGLRSPSVTTVEPAGNSGNPEASTGFASSYLALHLSSVGVFPLALQEAHEGAGA